MLKEENLRFVELIEELKQNGEITDYVHLASVLGTNKAGISDIRGGRKKISIELIRRMKLSYPIISIDWIVMGIGNKFCTDTPSDTHTHQYDNVELSNIFKQFEPILEQKDRKLLAQAEEIGTLKGRVRELENRLEKSVGSVSIRTANAG